MSAQVQPEPEGGHDLTARQHAILVFEHAWWRHAGQKDAAIREELGISPARYYQLLNALIDSPAALAHDPLLIKRLARLRESRIAARAARQLPPRQ